MRARPVIPGTVLRGLCAFAGVVNIVGNVVIVVAHRPLFDWLDVAPPGDLHLFAIQSALSFTMGVVALMIAARPASAPPLLAVGILGKGLYAATTYAFWAAGEAGDLYLLFAAFDAFMVVVFFLYLVQLTAPDLREMQTDPFDGIDVPERRGSRRALLVGFSLTGNGTTALERVRDGLRSRGYEVRLVPVVAQESVFVFPMSLGQFVRIVARAFVRRPARVAALDVDPSFEPDLVVVESPVWLLGMAAPVESALLDPANRAVFRGRDAAVVVVSRGAYQRTMAMAVRLLENLGANPVGARGVAHAGREPRRLMSLWFFLVFRRPGVPRGLAEPRYGPSPETLAALEGFGRSLADRSRTRPHWTLQLPPIGGVDG